LKSKLDKFQPEKFPPNQTFWFSPLNYYILTVAITIASFFTIWGVLHGLEDEMPWITAGIAASLVMISSVILRELILRKIYQKKGLVQNRLDYGIKSVYKIKENNVKSDRLTLQRNAEVLREIERKSKASKSFAKISASHLEVFEMCEAYLQKSNRELGGINKSSPRFAALSIGQKRIKELRRFHLMSWAALESQSFIQHSKVQQTINEKLENANRALEILDTAIQIYPQEQNLLESVEAIRDYIVSIKVNHWIEQAERAAFKENNKRAISHYKDALFFLARENERTPERELMAEKINLEIEKLREKLGRQIPK
jgi:hypothetical protein